MVLEKFLASARKKRLEKIKRELEELERKGLEYNPAPRKDIFSDKNERGKNASSKKPLARISAIIILILLAWFITRIYYDNKIDKLEAEMKNIKDELSLKTSELENKTSMVSSLLYDVEEKSQTEEELSQRYTDLEELTELLQENVDDLEMEKTLLLGNVTSLRNNLSDQKDLTDFYYECITDELDENISLCGTPP